MSSRTTTSKGLLILVMLGGLLMLPFGLFNQPGTLMGYALIFVGAVYNRVDSRFRGYKFSLSVGAFSAGLETRREMARPREAYAVVADDIDDDDDQDDEEGGGGHDPYPN